MKTWDELGQKNSKTQNLINKLVEDFNSLQNFEDAKSWDEQAQNIINLLRALQDDMNDYIQYQKSLNESLIKERSGGTLLQKIFSSRNHENEIKENIRKAEISTGSFIAAIEIISEMVDKTPTSKSEQKEIVESLKQIKKELTLQKREINEGMRKTRADARNKSVKWAGVNSGFLGSVARYNRISARIDKEQSLLPLEEQKSLIEKELISIERDINWVLRFKGSETPQNHTESNSTKTNSEISKYCPYCGRRGNSDICVGCGAVITINE